MWLENLRRWHAHRRDPVLGKYAVWIEVGRRMSPEARGHLADFLDGIPALAFRTRPPSRIVLPLVADTIRGHAVRLGPRDSAAEALAEALGPYVLCQLQRAMLAYNAGALALALDARQVTTGDLARALRAY